ncbi:MAG: chorismate mutase [Erysipelothrix sp.]|nr:chorismate mutase [Erysipelothrix sp.]
MENKRLELNAIDEQMRVLFEQRLDIVKEIGLYKLENDIPVYDQARELEIIKNNLAKLNDQSYAEYYEEFIKFQMDISKDLQAKIIKSK